MSLRSKIIAVVLAIGLLLIAIFGFGLEDEALKPTAKEEIKKEQPKDRPYVVSTNPDLMQEALIPPGQTIEITFSEPFENRGEVKYELMPEIAHEAQEANEKTTFRIVPKPLFKVGAGYTLRIKTETKFKSGKRLENDLNYSFKTIPYSGD